MTTLFVIALTGIMVKYIESKYKNYKTEIELQPVYLERVDAIQRLKNN